MTYKVMLVDDEPAAIKMLQYLVDWDALGFTVAAKALSVKEALAVFGTESFAVVIADIRMPGMSGLDLAEQIRELSDCDVIMVTGYEDFQYAQKAIKLHVRDYLLKPVEEKQLRDILLKIKEERDDKALVNRKLELSLPAARDQLLHNWLNGGGDWNGLREQFQLCGMDLAGASRMRCAAMDIDDRHSGREADGDRTDGMKDIRGITERALAGKGLVFQENRHTFGFVLYGDCEAMTLKEAKELMMQVHGRIANETAATATIALSEPFESAALAPQRYRQARQVLKSTFLEGRNTVVLFEQQSECPAAAASAPSFDSMRSVLAAVRTGNEALALTLLRQEWEGLQKARVGEDAVKWLALELFAQLRRIAEERFFEADEAFVPDDRKDPILSKKSSDSEYTRIYEARSMDELLGLAETQCSVIIGLLLNKRQSPLPEVMEQVKSLIRKQYREKISLKSISRQVYMSPGYLGQQFKQYEGLSFNEYLQQVRMERAKELLAYTNKRVYEVAEEVGYREVDWFSKKFKEVNGINAADYKDWLMSLR